MAPSHYLIQCWLIIKCSRYLNMWHDTIPLQNYCHTNELISSKASTELMLTYLLLFRPQSWFHLNSINLHHINVNEWHEVQIWIQYSSMEYSMHLVCIHGVALPCIYIWKDMYRKITNTRRTKFQYLNDSHFVLQLSLPIPLKPGVKLRMKM